MIGGHNERNNLQVVETICEIMDQVVSEPKVSSHKNLISFVKDRPGHDMRYAIDPSKIKNELGWSPDVTFEEGIRKTVLWYLKNQEWCKNVMSGKYKLERLGLNN